MDNNVTQGEEEMNIDYSCVTRDNLPQQQQQQRYQPQSMQQEQAQEQQNPAPMPAHYPSGKRVHFVRLCIHTYIFS